MFLSACLLSILACTLALPADGPVHIELPVYDQPQAGSEVRLAQPFDPENPPGEDRSSKSLVGGLLMHKIMLASNAIGSKIASTSHAKESLHLGPFAPPVTTLEGVLLESEGYGSKKLSIKENIQSLAAGFLQPKPIVDTIKEEEKYGNHGDKFYYAGRAIVGGAEGVSNLVNTILEVPANIFKKIARSATEKLNHLGGRLIGL